jgi:hypothetical protein
MSSSLTNGAIPEALRTALGEVIAAERREWRRERGAIEAESKAALSEFRAHVAELRAHSAVVDGAPSVKKSLDSFTEAAADRIARCVAAMQRDARAAEQRLDERMAQVEVRASATLGATAVTARGTWSKLATYRQNDIVAHNGASFIALRAKPGACPGPGWQLLASQGKRGERTAAVAGLAISDSGVLTVRCGDGSVKTLDLGPVLRKFAARPA